MNKINKIPAILFSRFDRQKTKQKLEKKANKAGFKVVRNPKTFFDYLCQEDAIDEPEKIKKAQEYGAKIISIEEFIAMIEDK